MSLEIQRDDNGMTRDDWRWLLWEMERHDIHQRWCALRALWCAPIKQRPRRGQWTIHDGFERNRDEEWTLLRAIVASLAIIIDRRGEDYGSSVALAYWDARDTYGGYTIDRVTLSAGVRVSIFNDGETLM